MYYTNIHACLWMKYGYKKTQSLFLFWFRICYLKPKNNNCNNKRKFEFVNCNQ